jgi:hypothetical protein
VVLIDGKQHVERDKKTIEDAKYIYRRRKLLAQLF